MNEGIEKKWVWTCIILQVVVAYAAASIIAMHRTRAGFNPMDAIFYYGQAFTCSTGAKMFGEIGVFFGGFLSLFLATTSALSTFYMFIGNLLLAASLVAPIYMVQHGMVPNCWSD